MNQVVKIFVALATVVALTNAQGYCVYSSIFSLRASNTQAELETVSSEFEEAVSNLGPQGTEGAANAVLNHLRFVLQIERDLVAFLTNYQNVVMNSNKLCTADFVLVFEAIEEVLDDLNAIIRAWIAALPNLTESDWETALPSFKTFVFELVSVGSKTNNLFIILAGYLTRETNPPYNVYSGTWPQEVDNYKMQVDELTVNAPLPPTPAPAPAP